MCVVVGWWLLSHVVVDVEIEIEKKRGKIEMGEEREMSFFFLIILLNSLYYFIGLSVKIKIEMWGEL